MRVERATCRANVLMAGVITDASTLTRPASPTGYRRRNRTDRQVGRLSKSSSRSERGTSSLPLSVVLPSGLFLSAKNLLPSFRKFPPPFVMAAHLRARASRLVRAAGSVEVRMSEPTSAPLLSSSIRRMSEHCDASRRRWVQVLARSPFQLEISDGLLMMMTMKAARRCGSIYGWHQLLPDQVTAFTPCSHCRRMSLCLPADRAIDRRGGRSVIRLRLITRDDAQNSGKAESPSHRPTDTSSRSSARADFVVRRRTAAPLARSVVPKGAHLFFVAF